MNFAFFEKMTLDEASAFLAEFLTCGRQYEPGLSAATDYSMSSLVPVLNEVSCMMRTTERQPDLTVPNWIRNTESYKEGLFDFDVQSQRLLMWTAF